MTIQYNPERMSNKLSVALCAALVSLVVGGCVWPGAIDQSVVGRYQRAMAARGPQPRGIDELAPLIPEPATQPPLNAVTDKETGQTRVLLSLDAAILRALANNLDIRVVSFDPAVSREEMIQAAAEFDYVLLAGWEYDRADLETTSAFISGQIKTRNYTAGISQKTITGAEVQLAWTLTQTIGSSIFSGMNEEWDSRGVLQVTQPLLRGGWPEFNLARLRVARLNYRTSIAEFRQRVEDVVTQVIASYWSLIQARRDRTIQQELLDRTIETRDRIDKRRAVDATEVEFMQSESAVARRRAILILADAAIGDAQDDLARIIGDSQLNLLSDYVILPSTRPSTERVSIDQADQLITALQYNPLLEQARLAIKIAGISVKVAENDTLPRLDFTASVTAQGIGPAAHEAKESMNTGDFVGYKVGLQFEYPLGNRERLANLRAQKLSRLKAVTAMQNTADVVALNVRNRIRRIDAAYREMKAQQEAVAASRSQLSALEASEEIRRMSPEFLQVKLSAQAELAVAEGAEIRSLIEYNTALVDLARQTGTVLQLHGVQIAMPAVLGEGEWPGDQNGRQTNSATNN